METITRNIVQAALIGLAAVLVTGDGAASEDQLNNEAIAKLINELVLTEKDTFLMDGRSYLSREAGTRINRAAEQLTAAGKHAWPQLFAHLGDKRESTPSAETSGPHDVGRKCYYILRFQVMDFPQGYPYQKTLASHQISFRPTIDAWLKQRQGRSLDEIRYEVVAILIDMESYANNRQAVALLEPHLAKIEERIKLAAKSNAIKVSISYGDEDVDGSIQFDNGAASGIRRLHYVKCISELKSQLDPPSAKVILTVNAGKRDLPWEREFFGLIRELQKSGRLEFSFNQATSLKRPE